MFWFEFCFVRIYKSRICFELKSCFVHHNKASQKESWLWTTKANALEKTCGRFALAKNALGVPWVHAFHVRLVLSSTVFICSYIYLCIQTIHPTSSEIYRNPLTEGSQKFHPTKPCLKKLQPCTRMQCTCKSGYTYKLEFKPLKRAQPQRRNRSRKIIWFNLPYNKNVKSKIGREFLRLINQNRGAFCLRMLCRKCFDVSNRWYAPALRVRKSQNGEQNFSAMEVVFSFFPL